MITEHSPSASTITVPPGKGIYDILVFIPTANEFQGILDEMRAVLTAKKFRESNGTSGNLIGARMFSKTVKDSKKKDRTFKVAVHCEDLRGNILTAAHTAYLCGVLSPKVVISAGIAGSFDPAKAWIGDVVMPTYVEHASFDKVYQVSPASDAGMPKLHATQINGTAFQSPMRLTDKRDHKFAGTAAFVTGLNQGALLSAIAYPQDKSKADERDRAFNALSQELQERYNIAAQAPRNPRVIANSRTFSWDKVFDSRDLYEYLRKDGRISQETLCVEMESWGFFSATELLRRIQNFDIAVVRGISDIVGCKGFTDDKGHALEGECRQLAMTNVARVVCEIVADEVKRSDAE